MTQPMLTLDNLSCERDDRVLFTRVSAQCEGGSLTQIVGFNGAGKTTLLRAIAGLQSVLTGQVLWRGEPVRGNRLAFARELLFLGHQVPVKAHLTPRENLHWLRQLLPTRADIDAETALAQVSLTGFEDIPCANLSAGQRRRVLLAQLYLSRARLWILDEPFTAIDRAGVAELEMLLARHTEEGGLALLTSHQPLSLPGLRTLDLADFQTPLEQEAYEY